MKVKYIGHMKTCRIKVDSSIINRWGRGEVKEISESLAKRLLTNNDFRIVGKVPTQKKVKKVIEEPKEITRDELEFDLNNDGVFDKKDTSMAGKTLAYAKKNI